MSAMEPWIERARAAWRWRGDDRPPFAVEPGPGQESVWDYPRPPAVEPVPTVVRIEAGGRTIAETRDAVRVLETAGAPTIYVPFTDLDSRCLAAETGGSVCEWKGPWIFWSLTVGGRTTPRAAWSYTEPFEGYEVLRDRLGFYPAKVDACWLGDVKVTPQPGGFYGGWVTPEVVGPMKGEPGTSGW